MKGYPHVVTIILHKSRFREMLGWLRDQQHELHQTMKFGDSKHKTGDDHVTQEVAFKDPNAAMLFKLAWGGS